MNFLLDTDMDLAFLGTGVSLLVWHFVRERWKRPDRH